MQAVRPEVIGKDQDFYGLQFQDYFVLHSVMQHTKTQRVGWIGGFSNLDFFVSQHGVDSITECINVDKTPVAPWCRKKHKEYTKKYHYKGKYEFIPKRYDSALLTGADFISTLSSAIDDVDIGKLPQLQTLVMYHYGSPGHIQRLEDSLGPMQRRIMTNNIVVYSTHILDNVQQDCVFLDKIGKSNTYKVKDTLCVNSLAHMTWDDKISHLMENLTKGK